MGQPLESERIGEIKSLLEPLMKERSIVSTLRMVEEAFVDGAVIWLDFGYFDMIKRQGFNGIDMTLFASASAAARLCEVAKLAV